MGVVPTSKARKSPAWSVYTSPYKTQADFQGAAHTQAMSQLQPQLDDISSQDRQATGAHATREKELQGWSSWFKNDLQDAFDRTNNALNKLITTSGQGSAADRSNLAAALAVPTNINQVGDVPNQNQDILAAAARVGQADQQQLTDNAGGYLGSAGSRLALAPTFAGEADRAETGRYNAVEKDLTQKRSDAMAQLPGLEKTAEGDLFNQEIQRGNLSESHANRLFQQWLASQQLGQSAQNQSFQQWLAKQNLGLDRSKLTEQTSEFAQTLGLDQQKLTNAITSGDPAKAKAKASQWNNALGLLSNYVTGFQSKSNGTTTVADSAHPGKTLTVKVDSNGKPLTYKDPNGDTQYVIATDTPKTYPHFNDAMRILTGQAGLSRSDALRLLQTSNFASWRDRAKGELIRLKRRKAGLKNPPMTIKNPTKLPKLTKYPKK